MKTASLFKTSRKIALSAAFILLAITALIAGWALYLNLGDNIHAVEDGILYRSAQLSPKTLESTIRKHGIETVINLRGTHTADKWYQGEVATTQALHVRHIDFKLSASRAPNLSTIAQLQKIIKDTPKPILIHCQGGADRSGLVAALYMHSILGKPAEEAEGQLSFYYGHFPWLWSRSGAMDIAFTNYVEKPHEFLIGKR